jgi:RNA polymerase sigma factor (sigma-70 family)
MIKNLDLPNEKALLSRLLKDDSKAYKTIYSETFPMLFSYIRDNSGSKEDAQDTIAEGFMALIKMAEKPGFELTCRVSVLLFSICRFIWLKELRRRKRDRDNEEKMPNFETVALPDFENQDDQSNIDPQDYCAEKAIQSLEEQDRNVVSWKHLEKKSHGEIAQQLNITIGYSKILLCRIMANIRRLADECIQSLKN